MNQIPSSETTGTPGAYDASFQNMWDQAADWWANHLRQDKNRRLQVFPLVLKMLGDPAGRHVLDAGCGEGTFARLLADGGAIVTGVDFSRMLNLALQHEVDAPRGIRYIKADLAELTPRPALPGGFDAIVCNLVLHCVPDLDAVLRPLEAQLKPGGMLLVSDLHPDTFPLFARAWTTCVHVRDHEYRYTLSPECPQLTMFLHSLADLRSAFERSGFACLEELAPSISTPAGIGTELPQFIYYRLERTLPERCHQNAE